MSKINDYRKRVDQNFDQLSKGLKKVARYLLADPTSFAIWPAKEVGEAIGVSETMVIRLANALGYTGYSELQDEVKNYIYNLNKIQDTLRDSESREQLTLYEQMIKRDQSNIEEMMRTVKQENIDLAVGKLLEADKVTVAGFHQSFSMAHWFSFNLNYILGNSSLFRPESEIPFVDTTKNSCLVVFSFYRYALELLRLAEEAQNRGIFVIGITDSTIAPVAEYADLLIALKFSNRSPLDTGPVTFSLINTILTAISIKKNNNQNSFYPKDTLRRFFTE